MTTRPALDLGPYRVDPRATAKSDGELPEFVRNWFAVADHEMQYRKAA